jgi:hypothetical protein
MCCSGLSRQRYAPPEGHIIGHELLAVWTRPAPRSKPLRKGPGQCSNPHLLRISALWMGNLGELLLHEASLRARGRDLTRCLRKAAACSHRTLRSHSMSWNSIPSQRESFTRACRSFMTSRVGMTQENRGFQREPRAGSQDDLNAQPESP